MARTVAVTGATGFIGSHIVGRLRDAGWQVRALVRRPADSLPTDMDRVRGSLEDGAALRRLVGGVDAVVHSAGLVKATRRGEFFRVNEAGTAALRAATAAEAPQARFLLISSLAAREPQLSAYAASKRAAEAVLAGAGRLSAVALRPPAVYGPGDREILPLFRAVGRGLAPRLGPRQQRFSLIHADDLARAVVALLDCPAAGGEVYEIDDGKPEGYAWAELVAALAAITGRRPRPVPVPGSVLGSLAAVNAAAGLLFAAAPMLTPGKVRELRHPDWVCRDRRLPERTGWRPQIGLAEGLAQTAAWYRQHGWL